MSYVYTELNFDYTDIKKLRKEKHISAKELAEVTFISTSYLSLLENGKRELSLNMYKTIVDNIINFEKVSTEKSNPFSDKVTIVNKILTNYLENNKFVWDDKGVNAIEELILLYNKKNRYILIQDDSYPAYTESGIEILNIKNKIFEFDKERFEMSVINNDIEEFLETLVIPTKEGIYLDCHSLNTKSILFSNKVPIIKGAKYKIRFDTQSSLKGKVIGHLDYVLNMGNTLYLFLSDIDNPQNSLGYFEPHQLEFIEI